MSHRYFFAAHQCGKMAARRPFDFGHAAADQGGTPTSAWSCRRAPPAPGRSEDALIRDLVVRCVASAGPARRAPSLCRTRSHGPHHGVIPEIQLVRGDRAPRICPNKKKGEYRRSTAPSSLRGLTRQDTCPDPDRTTSARPAHQQHPVRHRHYPVCVPHHPHSVYSRSPPTPRPRFRCSNS